VGRIGAAVLSALLIGSAALVALLLPPDLAGRFAARGLTLLVAASLPGLAEALAHRALGDGSLSGTLLLAWTRPGKSPAAMGWVE